MKYLHSPICYAGGKGIMIGKLLKIVPEGGIPYVEPYCGGASLFFAREPAPTEVLNDINGDVVNLFRCLQDKKTFEKLRHKIFYTLYSREEFETAWDIIHNNKKVDKITRAWAFFVIQNQSFSGLGLVRGKTSWSYAVSGKAGSINKWLLRLSMLDSYVLRLRAVQIEHKDALDVIKRYDNKNAVFYIDPPYVPEVRGDKKLYVNETTLEHHRQLVNTLLNIKGKAVLSCYWHSVYQQLIDNNWKRKDFKTASHIPVKSKNSGLKGIGNTLKKVPRVETVIYSPNITIKE